MRKFLKISASLPSSDGEQDELFKQNKQNLNTVNNFTRIFDYENI